MSGRVPRDEYPWWVKVSMWGVPGRAGLWAFVVLSIACAAGSVAYGFRDQRFFIIAVFCLLAAIPYWLSIRWVDRHGSWQQET
ncbi:MAG: hypothetical protein WD069_01955 [Planctomycetales bacterium]